MYYFYSHSNNLATLFLKKLVQVGSHEGWFIPIKRLIECSIFGFNENGFKKLMQSEFGGEYFDGKSWATLGEDVHTRIEDLLGN